MPRIDTVSQQPGWRLDQVANAGRENLDAEHVARYDAIENASPEREVTLLQQWGLRRDSVVVELGTGTGQFAIAAAHVCDRVVAVDVSSVMIAELQDKLTRQQVDNVDVVQAGFLDYEHQGAAADIVYSRYALHHLPDFWKGVALARVHRTLRPGGLLRVWDVVYSFEPHEAEDRLEAWCATGGPDGGDGWSRADYEEHVRDEHSTYTWVFSTLALRAGFHIEAAEYSEDGIFAEYLFRRPQRVVSVLDPLPEAPRRVMCQLPSPRRRASSSRRRSSMAADTHSKIRPSKEPTRYENGWALPNLSFPWSARHADNKTGEFLHLLLLLVVVFGVVSASLPPPPPSLRPARAAVQPSAVSSATSPSGIDHAPAVTVCQHPLNRPLAQPSERRPVCVS